MESIMKKAALIFNLVIIIYLFASCATSKEARNYEKTIDGNWQLQTVVTDGIIGKVNIQLFNEAAFSCFIGSGWSFNARNSLGKYSVPKNGTACDAIQRNIRWTIFEAKNEPKLLQFKKLDDKLKEMENGDGYRFTIVQLDKNTMQLKSNITFENRPVAIIYNFVRN